LTGQSPQWAVAPMEDEEFYFVAFNQFENFGTEE